MKAIFEQMTINYILLEEGENEALIDAVITQNGKAEAVKLYLSDTDLNQLFLKLQANGAEVSLNENFSCYQTESGSLYTLDMKQFGWDTIMINEFSPIRNIKQVRA